MCRCRSQHNHRRSSCRTLTPPSPRRVDCCFVSGSRPGHPLPTWPRPWASRAMCLQVVAPLSRTGRRSLHDRSSRPRRSPARTSVKVEERICRIRRNEKLGPDRLGGRLGIAPSTVDRVLVRHDLSRLSHIDRQSGREIRRYERARPGELVHVDVKKLGKIPPGGGHKTRDEPRHAQAKNVRGGLASLTSTRPSMTIPAWPIPRSLPMRPERPAPPSGAEPSPSFEPTASSSNGS